MEKLAKLQKLELEMMKEFIKICDKHKLTYFIVGGTLIGAVRHKGFIPWDDDIDVAMPRPDYDKFIIIAQKELPEGLFLQSYQTDKKYRYNFAKIRNTNTYILEKATQYSNINHGIYIDIFPIDGIKERKGKIAKSVPNKIRALWVKEFFIARASEIHKFRAKHFFKDLLVNLIAIIFLPFNIHNWLNRSIDKSLKKVAYGESAFAGSYFGRYFIKEVMPIDYYGKGTLLQFEDIQVNAPIQYDDYLTRIYGDYMKLPPKEKQVCLHASILDLEKSYKEYVK